MDPTKKSVGIDICINSENHFSVLIFHDGNRKFMQNSGHYWNKSYKNLRDKSYKYLRDKSYIHLRVKNYKMINYC
jgi:predicted double-glycine peptidase